VPQQAVDKGYEPIDARPRRIAWVAPGLFLVIVVFAAGVWGMIRVLQGLQPPERATAIETSRALVPEPRLQANPQADLAALRAHEHEILTNYGWVDRDQGIARIPIDQAMEILQRRGWPAQQEPTP
jgi:hypothetical protein